jgi:GT2 family glycosyltransferase
LVFGACAAAALYRRRMIQDVSVDGHFFDPDFFAYREDADVAWRAQLLGWNTIYTPEAVGYHVRSVTPLNRRSTPAFINMHSVKNRFLMRVKNLTPDVFRRHWRPMALRDALVLGACFVTEPKSLAALWHFARCCRGAWSARRRIMARRVLDEGLADWFSEVPAARELSPVAEQATVAG